MRMSDRAEERPGRHRGYGMRCSGVVPALSSGEPGRAEMDRLRMARTLVYEDMVERTGRVWWGCLESWDYQPSEEEITRAILQGGHDAAWRRGHRRRHRRDHESHE